MQMFCLFACLWGDLSETRIYNNIFTYMCVGWDNRRWAWHLLHIVAVNSFAHWAYFIFGSCQIESLQSRRQALKRRYQRPYGDSCKLMSIPERKYKSNVHVKHNKSIFITFYSGDKKRCQKVKTLKLPWQQLGKQFYVSLSSVLENQFEFLKY